MSREIKNRKRGKGGVRQSRSQCTQSKERRSHRHLYTQSHRASSKLSPIHTHSHILYIIYHIQSDSIDRTGQSVDFH